MDGGNVGTGAASSFPGGSGPFWAPANDEVVYTTEEATPTANLRMGGGAGFVLSGKTPSPSQAAEFATAALAASFRPIPPGDISQGGNVSGDCDWGPRSHKEPLQVNGQGFGDNREEWVQTAGCHGGNAGAWDHGDGTFTKRQARMHALELELLERGQSSKRARSTMVPSLPVAYDTGFLPSSRDLMHLPQDNRRRDNAMHSTATNPGTPFGARIKGTTKAPIAAIRRRRRGCGVQEEQASLRAELSGKQDHHLHTKGPSGKSAEQACSRALVAIGVTNPKAGKRNIGNRCQHPGCSRGSTFGRRGGARSTIYCATHKHEGMVKITSRQCAEDMCSTAPSYAFEGHRASCCSKHKMPGMVNVVTPRCQKSGCASCASYGYMEERRPLFCARHAQDGMSNVVSRRCLGAGCTKNPSYGHPGDRRASFCVDHQQAGMSNIVSPKCLAPGCSKAPSFGASGDRKASWCKTHKQDGMINILYSRQLKRGG